MSGLGKYTSYTGLSKPTDQLPKANFLKKLFGSHVTPAEAPPQVVHDPADENGMREDIIAIAKQQLQPSKQIGDAGYFPAGVDMTYGNNPVGDPNVTNVPVDLAAVTWTTAGDPANPYAPDITSPGPGKTEGSDKNTDPQIKTTDLKPNYVPGAPGTGTKSPVASSAKIVAANILGVAAKDGDSGANV
jgi:hypothetical protein